MGKSKQQSTTQQSQEQNPYGPAQGGINSILEQAKALQRERALAPADPTQLQAADLLEQLAQQGTSTVNPALGFANEAFNVALDPGADILSQAARGDFLSTADPLLNEIIQNRQTSTADLIRRQAAAAGRAASPAETGILARELGKIGLEADLSQFNISRGQQLDAANQLFGTGAGLIGQIPALQGAELFEPGLLQQAGDIRQEAAQTELDNLAQVIAQQQGVYFPAGQLGGTSTGTSATNQVSRANPVTQGIRLIHAIGSLRGG